MTDKHIDPNTEQGAKGTGYNGCKPSSQSCSNQFVDK